MRMYVYVYMVTLAVSVCMDTFKEKLQSPVLGTFHFNKTSSSIKIT